MVHIEKDVSDSDRFGRLLRYVCLEDGLMVNELLVLEGYAQASSYPPDVNYQDRSVAAQQQAGTAGRGLWGPACAAGAGGGADSSENGGDCSPAYPGVCIQPPPPDLDCADIPHRRFQCYRPTRTGSTATPMVLDVRQVWGLSSFASQVATFARTRLSTSVASR
jgi:micrococcal nuclease